jgi:hypothetical protein
MALAELIVLNRRRADGPPTALLPDAFVLRTCQSEVRIATQPVEHHPTSIESDAAGYELHRGAEAYRFLLQLACGLDIYLAG